MLTREQIEDCRPDHAYGHGAMKCAAAIRALAPREQNAATQAGQTGWKPDSIAPSHEGHAAGPAVAAPNGAMDGDIVEFLCGGGTFKGCWYGGEKPSDEKGNFWWRKYLRAALRAAPSLTQLEDAIVEAIRFIGVKSGIPATVYGEMCHEVRAKLREQEREGKDG